MIARYKAQHPTLDNDNDNWSDQMRIVSVNFNREHKIMLGHAKMIMEQHGGQIAINPVFDKLITSLRTAVDADGKLDKESTSYHDIFDAFRLTLRELRRCFRLQQIRI